MFDCVLATRLGRHGVMFSDQWNIHITNAKYKNDYTPFSTLSIWMSKYSKAYIHHLIREKEMLGGILLSLHNIIYLHDILTKWKNKLLTK
jgi:queuine tRNA-ribosyltransferase